MTRGGEEMIRMLLSLEIDEFVATTYPYAP